MLWTTEVDLPIFVRLELTSWYVDDHYGTLWSISVELFITDWGFHGSNVWIYGSRLYDIWNGYTSCELMTNQDVDHHTVTSSNCDVINLWPYQQYDVINLWRHRLHDVIYLWRDEHATSSTMWCHRRHRVHDVMNLWHDERVTSSTYDVINLLHHPPVASPPYDVTDHSRRRDVYRELRLAVSL